MAVIIKIIGNCDIVGGKTPEQEVDIIADKESEITALKNVITCGSKTFKVKPGSIAHTAGFGALYEMSPSGVWTEVV